MKYITDGKTEHIEGEDYRSDDFPTYTLLLRFFDMIIDRSSEQTVHDCLIGMKCDEISYEDACEYLPLFRLLNPDSHYYKMELIDLFEFYESGREILSDIFREQRENEENFYKTLYLRSFDKEKASDDADFFKQIDLRNVREPSETIWEFFIYSFDRLATESNRSGGAAVYIGQCERCFSHYPIRRTLHGALAKNRFCENCRNSMAAMLSSKAKKSTPLYAEYQKIYNKYYQRFKRLGNITYDQFRDVMLIAGNIRDDFLVKGIEDKEQYREAVDKKIREWENKKKTD